MKIYISKKQYAALIKLTYLGNWVINACRLQDEKIDEFDELEQYILSFADKFHIDEIVHHKELGYLLNENLEEELHDFLAYYENENFWQELVSKLSIRDAIKKYGVEKIQQMDTSERFKKQFSFEEKYDKEFEKNGIENLVIK